MTLTEQDYFMKEPIDWDAYREINLARLDDRREVSWKDAEEDARAWSAEEAQANQATQAG
jgi:hypothetical protein